MRIILITHAETNTHPPRCLSDAGREQARALVGFIADVMGADFRIKKAVSSPAVRCIETALIVLDALSADTLRRLDTDPRLMAAKEPMESDQLHRALIDYACDGMLVSLHADLANALPKRDTIPNTADGWFQTRPVLCLLDWEPDRGLEESRILRLLGPNGAPLLPPEAPSDTPLLG
ncbi:MAG: histidine phosphatase family protein [Deltaproteobacteria bacterium]|nr:histidine phosphatase family protein [Candidatus Zymogenaceae bacterium]